MYYGLPCSVNCLEGKEFLRIEGLEKDSRQVTFISDKGPNYVMLHEQDCCESVSLEEFSHAFKYNEPFKVLTAEERTKHGDKRYESETWTFYDIQTNKGYLQLRWYGTSNGYYSEEVEIYEEKK